MTQSLLAALQGNPPRIVAIGASAGAVDALGLLLPQLPATLPATVVVVVHVPPDAPSALPGLFAPRCALTTCEVEDKMELRSGRIYFAPPDYHVLAERDGTLALSVDEPVNHSRPPSTCSSSRSRWRGGRRHWGFCSPVPATTARAGWLACARPVGSRGCRHPRAP